MNAITKYVKCGHQVQFLSKIISTCLAQKKNIHLCEHFLSMNSTEELDDNERALKELDITLLKPHPEWRNVAAGPVWGKENEYFELLWKHWLDEPFVERYQKEHDKEWDDYVEKFGETPIDYMLSKDYQTLYKDENTWVNYRRNHKGFIPSQTSRVSCMKDGVVASGSPCPLCRDERLLMTYKNLPLLKQYIDEQTGDLQNPLRIGLCQFRLKRLAWSFTVAKDLGYLPSVVPHVKFDMNHFKLNHYVL